MDAKEKDEKILYYLAKVVQDLALKNYTEIVKTIKELLEIDEKADYGHQADRNNQCGNRRWCLGKFRTKEQNSGGGGQKKMEDISA